LRDAGRFGAGVDGLADAGVAAGRGFAGGACPATTRRAPNMIQIGRTTIDVRDRYFI